MTVYKSVVKHASSQVQVTITMGVALCTDYEFLNLTKTFSWDFPGININIYYLHRKQDFHVIKIRVGTKAEAVLQCYGD